MLDFISAQKQFPSSHKKTNLPWIARCYLKVAVAHIQYKGWRCGTRSPDTAIIPTVTWVSKEAARGGVQDTNLITSMPLPAGKLQWRSDPCQWTGPVHNGLPCTVSWQKTVTWETSFHLEPASGLANLGAFPYIRAEQTWTGLWSTSCAPLHEHGLPHGRAVPKCIQTWIFVHWRRKAGLHRHHAL